MPINKLFKSVQEITSVQALDFLLQETTSLLEQLRGAVQTYPRAGSVHHPFHPSYRPEPEQKPTKSQQLAIKWRDRLEARNAVLRDYFVLRDRGDVLQRYPLAGCGSAPNFGCSLTAQDCIEALQRELFLLTGELNARHSETEAALFQEDGCRSDEQAEKVQRGRDGGLDTILEPAGVTEEHEEPLLTARQAAEKLGLPLQRVYELARMKVLAAVRFGRQVRFDPRALEKFIRGGGKKQ